MSRRIWKRTIKTQGVSVAGVAVHALKMMAIAHSHTYFDSFYRNSMIWFLSPTTHLPRVKIFHHGLEASLIEVVPVVAYANLRLEGPGRL